MTHMGHCLVHPSPRKIQPKRCQALGLGSPGDRHLLWGKLVSREPRVIVAGGIYHVYARGNNRGTTFRDNVDRYLYLQLLDKVLRKHASNLLVYVLMSNHVHLILQI